MYVCCVHGRGLSKVHTKSWLNDFQNEDNAARCRCASQPLYKDWMVVSLINQVGGTSASFLFSVSCLIVGWLLMVGGAAGR